MLDQLKLQSWGSGDGFISCFPHRPESLCSAMHHPYKKIQAWMAYIYNSSAWGREEWRQQFSNWWVTGSVTKSASKIRGDRSRTSRHLMLTHGLLAHTHMHMTTYVHHVHVIIWRRGYKKNLTDIGILWQNRNHICLTTSPEGGHLPRAYVTRVGQGQFYGASHYSLRCYRELFSAMAHSQVLRKDPYDVLSEYNPDLSTSTAPPLTKS